MPKNFGYHIKSWIMGFAFIGGLVLLSGFLETAL